MNQNVNDLDAKVSGIMIPNSPFPPYPPPQPYHITTSLGNDPTTPTPNFYLFSYNTNTDAIQQWSWKQTYY